MQVKKTRVMNPTPNPQNLLTIIRVGSGLLLILLATVLQGIKTLLTETITGEDTGATEGTETEDTDRTETDRTTTTEADFVKVDLATEVEEGTVILTVDTREEEEAEGDINVDTTRITSKITVT